MHSRSRIYLDLDGVFADFQLGGAEAFGVSRQEFYDLIPYDNKVLRRKSFRRLRELEPNFWAELPLMPNALNFWKLLKRDCTNLWFLTGLPGNDTWDPRACEQQKKEWVYKYLGHPKDRVICVESQIDKAQYAPACLVDDQPRTIDVFVEARGYGILYTPDQYARCARLATEWQRIQLTAQAFGM
jgi:hypothetical protein